MQLTQNSDAPEQFHQNGRGFGIVKKDFDSMMVTGTASPGRRELTVHPVELIACLIVVTSVVNVYAARLGTVPDMMLLGVAMISLAWIAYSGFEAKRIRTFVAAVVLLFFLYLLLSTYHLSYLGFRNAASLLTVVSVFLFFFTQAHRLLRSQVYLAVLIFAFTSLLMLRVLPVDLAKNLVNSATCYYAIVLFLRGTQLRAVKIWQVATLLAVTMILSIANDHRTLAGLSLLLFLQFLVLSTNRGRRLLRTLMFAGILAVGVGVVALLVHEEMALFAQAINNFLASEGERTMMSGREVIWPALWDAILRNPVLGLDPGASTGSLYVTTHSAHNFYLEVGLQLGFVGIAVVVFMFWSLWRLAYPGNHRIHSGAENLMTVLVTMVMTHSMFDVFLTQDSLAVGVPVWMALGIGLGGLRANPVQARFVAPDWDGTGKLNRLAVS